MSKTEDDSEKTFIENFILAGISGIQSHSTVYPYERVRMLVNNQWRFKDGETHYKGFIDCAIKMYRNDGLTSFWKGNLLRCIRYFPEQSFNFALKEEIRKAFKHRNQNDMDNLSFIKNFFSGSFAGVLSLIILHPFNLTFDALINDRFHELYRKKRYYNSIMDAFTQKVAHRGVIGWYRDIKIRFFGVLIYRGCYFGFYDTLRPIVLKPDANFLQLFVFGYLVTITSALISFPVNAFTLAFHLTNGDGYGHRYKGIFDYLCQTVKQQGFIGLFKGARLYYTRCLMGAGVLAGFDKLSQIYTNAHQKLFWP